MVVQVCDECGDQLCRHDLCSCSGVCEECRLERETVFMEEPGEEGHA